MLDFAASFCSQNGTVNEFACRAGEPCREHQGVGSVQRAQPVPASSVPAEAPIVDDARNGCAINPFNYGIWKRAAKIKPFVIVSNSLVLIGGWVWQLSVLDGAVVRSKQGVAPARSGGGLPPPWGVMTAQDTAA